MRKVLVALAIVGSAACSHFPAVRSGPAMPMAFSPPPGMVLINRAVEVRIETLEFPKGAPRVVRIESQGVTEERYEAIPEGGFRVTTTLLDATTTRDGTAVPDAFSLSGIAIVHRIDKDGHWLGVENTDQVLEAIRGRLRTPEMRRNIEPQLTPQFVTKPAEAAWRQRFDRYCGKSIDPGFVTYSVDNQPVDEIGPIRTILREVVVGQATTGTRSGLEIELDLGGKQAEFARSPGALDALLPYAEGVATLSDDVSGKGHRLIDLSTCQTYNEEINIKGDGRLNKRGTETQSMLLPLKVRYEVHRQVLRMSPAEAQSLGVTTHVRAPGAPAAPPAAPPGS